LADHVDLSDGVWIKFAKKGNPAPSVTYAEALDVALCYGWIDGQKKPFDAMFWLQRFVPRRAKSIWSKRNQEHVARLIAEGKMRPAGLAAVERAKADGRWERAYDPQTSALVPEDFQVALDASPRAKAFFGSLNKANTYAILFRLQNARKAETRLRKIGEFVAMLEQGKTFH